MMQLHKYSLTELEEMISWERALYIDMLHQYLKAENEKTKDLQAAMQAAQRIRTAK